MMILNDFIDQPKMLLTGSSCYPEEELFRNWNEEDPSGIGDERPRILVIESDSLAAHRIRLFLTDLGKVITQYTLESALEGLEDEPCDVIITSLDWPMFHDEAAIIEALRGLPGFAEIPILATGLDERQESRDIYQQLGYYAYFPRPLDPWSIRRAIAELLKTA